jgi:carbonic anhydrase
MASENPHRPMSHYLQENQDRIFANNRNWVASRVAEDPEFFAKLSSGQHPDYL